MHDHIAAAILKEQTEQTRLLGTLVILAADQVAVQQAILHHLRKNVIAAVITQQGEQMNNPGTQHTFVVTLTPADATFDPTKAAVTSSDSVNFPAVLGTDGLTITTDIPATAPPADYTLTWDYTNADGIAVQAIEVVTVTAVVIDVTSASIAETV